MEKAFFKSFFLRYLVEKKLFDAFITLLTKGKIEEDFFDKKIELWEHLLAQKSFIFCNMFLERVLVGEIHGSSWEEKVCEARFLIDKKRKRECRAKIDKSKQKHYNNYYNKFNTLKSKNYDQYNFRSCHRLPRR